MLLREAGYTPVAVTGVDAALNAASERKPVAAIVWLEPGAAEALLSLRLLADRLLGAPVLSAVGPEGSALHDTAKAFGATESLVIASGSGLEALDPLARALDRRRREVERHRPGHAIP